jgi:hypothetical protein
MLRCLVESILLFLKPIHHVHLFYFSDFAYPTVKDRMPVILTKVIDKIYRMKADIGQEIGEV